MAKSGKLLRRPRPRGLTFELSAFDTVLRGKSA
jgi:hypothetical protein